MLRLVKQKIQTGQKQVGFVQERVSQILQSFGNKNKKSIPFIFLRIGQEVGFQIFVQFSENRVHINGSLHFENGRPVQVQHIYRASFLEEAKKCLDGRIKVYFSTQNNSFCFESDMKIDQLSQECLSVIYQHFQTTRTSLLQIYNYLVIFGICTAKNKLQLLCIKKKLQMMRKIVNVTSQENTDDENLKMYNKRQENQKSGKSSVFRYFDKINKVNSFEKKKVIQEETSTEIQRQQENVRVGGYFSIQKIKFSVEQIFDRTQKQKNVFVGDFALKMFRKEQQNFLYNSKKLKKQIEIVNQIIDPKNSLTYWLQSCNIDNPKSYTDENVMLMEYVEEKLQDLLCYQCSRTIHLQQIIDFSKQIVEAIQILHDSGIVHRDLKPQNVLISQKFGKKVIKIIDFGESSLMSDTFSSNQEDILGATVPYSPIQCFVVGKQGFNLKQIDYWSVGMLLYEIFFKTNPVSYSRCFGSDIYKGWRMPGEFSLCCFSKKKHGIQAISEIYTLIALNAICIDQKKRMNLKKMKKILEITSNFMEDILSF